MMMFGRRRRAQRDELMMMHARIAEIHADMVRRDEELRLDLGTRRQLISAVEQLTDAAHGVEERLLTEGSLADALQGLLVARETAAIDLGERPRVLGGTVESPGRSNLRRLDA
jgi:hypothetical protein